MKNTIVLLAVIALLTSLGRSQEAASPPTTSTAPATAPAATQPTTTTATTQATTQTTQPLEPAILAILDALEKSGQAHKTIRGDLNYQVTAGKGLGDVEVRTGYVMYQKNSDDDFTRFRIHFDTLRQGDGPNTRELVDYAFGPDEYSSQWLSVAEHANKKLRKIQVAAAGEKKEPLRIGKGPFPLPFGQKTADVVKTFVVTTRPLAAGEPKGTDYLKLVPKPEYKKEINFVELQMWVDQKLGLPIKVISKESNKTVTTVLFENLTTNNKIDASNFVLERPNGWTLETKRLQEDQE